MTVALDTPEVPAPAELHYAAPVRPRRRRSVWPAYAFASFILAFPFGLGFLIGIAIVFGAAIFGYSMQQAFALLSDGRVLLGLMLLQTLMNVSFVAGYQYLSRYVRSYLPILRRPRAGWLMGMLLALGAFGIVQLYALAQYAMEAHSHSMETIGQMLDDTRQLPGHPFQVPLIPLLIIGVIGPVSEELVFRGIIQTGLVRRHGFWLGALITNLFFGVYHFDLVQGFFAFILGIYLSLVTYRTRSILYAVICHMVVNMSSTIFFYTGFHIVGTSWIVTPAIACVLATLGALITVTYAPFARRPRM